jgi:hypothetical protein
MPNWRFALRHLFVESWSARQDARVRFLVAQVTLLRRKLGGNRVATHLLHSAKRLAERWSA